MPNLISWKFWVIFKHCVLGWMRLFWTISNHCVESKTFFKIIAQWWEKSFIWKKIWDISVKNEKKRLKSIVMTEKEGRPRRKSYFWASKLSVQCAGDEVIAPLLLHLQKCILECRECIWYVPIFVLKNSPVSPAPQKRENRWWWRWWSSVFPLLGKKEGTFSD